MRFVCTWKPNEYGEPYKPKARLVVVGFRGKQKLDVPRDAHTPSKEGARVVLFLCVQNGFRVRKWDARQAFLHSGREHRWKRQVWLKPPKEAGLPPNLCWKAERAIYGLVDGPYEWIVEVELVFKKRGFKQSKCDLSLFFFVEEGVFRGSVCLHYDDLLWGGDARMEKVMELIQTDLHIGTVEKDNFVYLGMRLRTVEHGQSQFSIFLDQETYAKGNLKEMSLSRARRAQKGEPLTDSEWELFRTLLGSLMWLAVCTRLDLAYYSSPLSRHVTDLRVRHVLRLNKAVRLGLLYACHGLWFHKLQLKDNMKPTLVSFTDSSLQNEEGEVGDFKLTQQGQLVLATDNRDSAQDFGREWTAANILSYRSGKCMRVIHSTFAGETLSGLEGVDKIVWLSYLLAEARGRS